MEIIIEQKLDALFNLNDFVTLEIKNGLKVGLILNSISLIGEMNVYSFLVTNYCSEKLPELDEIISANSTLTIYESTYNDLPEGYNKNLNRIMIEEQFIKKEKSRFTLIGKINFATDMEVSGGYASDWETINFVFPYHEYKKKVEEGGTCKITEIPFSKHFSNNSINIITSTPASLANIFSFAEKENKTVDSKKFIKSVKFKSEFYDIALDKTIILTNISVDNSDALESLVNPDELVLTYDKYKILIDYAIMDDEIFELEKPNENGTTKLELLKQIRKIYYDLLIHEFESEKDFFLTFDLTDLGVYELENGEIILELRFDT